MPTADKFNPGAYRAGDSYLHLFDARLKLLLLLGLVACLFSATSPVRLLWLALLWGAGASFCANALRDSWRVVTLLRWLLLFTLLLHLFFTPGRTLFGTSWLSLDGLLRGLLIDAQLLLTVFFSMLLAWTTRPEHLAWALTGLLAPLQRLGVFSFACLYTCWRLDNIFVSSPVCRCPGVTKLIELCKCSRLYQSTNP